MREEIIRLAKQCWPPYICDDFFEDSAGPLMEFANLIMQQYGEKVREAAAGVCVACELIEFPAVVEIAAVRKCAAAIRSMPLPETL